MGTCQWSEQLVDVHYNCCLIVRNKSVLVESWFFNSAETHMKKVLWLCGLILFSFLFHLILLPFSLLLFQCPWLVNILVHYIRKRIWN